MAHVAWRQSGLPPTNVIGAGCNLDSERVSHALDINLNTHKPAWVIGELSDNKGEPERIDYVFTRRPRVAFSVCSSITQLYYLIQPLPSPVVLSCDHLGFICFALNRADVTRNAAPPAHRVCRFHSRVCDWHAWLSSSVFVSCSCCDEQHRAELQREAGDGIRICHHQTAVRQVLTWIKTTPSEGLICSWIKRMRTHRWCWRNLYKYRELDAIRKCDNRGMFPWCFSSVCSFALKYKTYLFCAPRAFEIVKNRGQRSWSVGLSIADITNSVLTDKKKTHSVSTLAQVEVSSIKRDVSCSFSAS